MILPGKDSEGYDEPPAYVDAIGTASPSTPVREPKGQQALTIPERPPPLNSSASTSRSSGLSSAAAWFSFGAISRTDKEVKKTVLGLIRDVVRQTPGPAAVSIFQSCAEACRARQIQFDVLLQERSIEGHTPLFWAILKRKSTDQLGLLDLLLSIPLTSDTRSDAALACMLQSDNELFQRLQHSPGWKESVMSGAEEMLLGSSPEDSVSVVDVEGDIGAFKAMFLIPEFQQRMRVSRAIQIEFIARERLWAFTFSREPLSGTRRWSKKQSWIDSSPAGYVGITILDESAPTPFTGRITLENTRHPSRAPMTIILKSTSDLKPSRWPGDTSGVCSLDLATTTDGASLQHSGSSYIGEDNNLRFILEAKLTKNDPECVIM